jgi:tetratricopeptide (TPR) repeat protein
MGPRGNAVRPVLAVRIRGLCTLLYCVLSLVLSSLPVSAQAPPSAVESSSQNTAPGRVSARELSIPEKARKAFNKGTDLLVAQRSAESIPEFHRAIKIFPDFYEAYYKIGIAQLNLHRVQEAQAAFETSIQISGSGYPPAQFGLGVALAIQNQFSAAQEAIRAGLDADSRDAAGNFTLAWVLFRAGKLPEAEKYVGQAILSNANLASAYLLLAQIHARRNETTALVADLDAYLRLDPQGPHNAEAQALRAHAQQLLSKQQSASPAPAQARIPQP